MKITCGQPRDLLVASSGQCWYPSLSAAVVRVQGRPDAWSWVPRYLPAWRCAVDRGIAATRIPDWEAPSGSCVFLRAAPFHASYYPWRSSFRRGWWLSSSYSFPAHSPLSFYTPRESALFQSLIVGCIARITNVVAPSESLSAPAALFALEIPPRSGSVVPSSTTASALTSLSASKVTCSAVCSGSVRPTTYARVSCTYARIRWSFGAPPASCLVWWVRCLLRSGF